jgi:hypothetical protein
MGTSFKKVRLLFHKVSLRINTFSTLLGPLQARRVSSRVVYWDCRDDDGQSTPLLKLPPLCTDRYAGWRLSCRRKSWFIFLFGRTLRIHSFNFFNVWTCRSKLWHLWPRIPLTRSLHYPRSRCHGWSISAGHVTIVLFSALKTTDPVFNCANICGTVTIHASEKSMNLCWTAAFCSKKFSHHSVPCTYIHNISHFALLLCGTHVTDWNTHDIHGDEECCWWLGKARNSTKLHI